MQSVKSRGDPVFREINNEIGSSTVCVLWQVTKAPVGIQVASVARSAIYVLRILAGLSKKLARDELSLSLFICLSRISYTQDSVVGLREEKEKEEKEKKKEEVEAGAFVLPAFYLGSACSQACGRSLPAVYEGRKQWPR